MKKISYELTLSKDKHLQSQCIKILQDRFKSKVLPLFKDNDSDVSEYQLQLTVQEKEIWDVARSIIEIEGVIDVDPGLTTSMDAVYQNLVSKEYEVVDEDKDRPDPDWYHKNIKFQEALDYVVHEFKNNRGHFDPEKRYRMAQFDTGYTLHPEIYRINKNEGYSYVASWFRRVINPNWRRDARDRLRNLRPVLWASHGTSTAAVIVGSTTRNININAGIRKDRVDGLMPNNVDLVPFRVSQNILSFDNKVHEAGLQAIRDGFKVITMSHASLFPKRKWKEVVKKAYDNGVIWVAAGGTHAPEKLQKIIVFPAKFRETIAVAASTIDDLPWERTHYGPEIDFCAPGVDIYIPSSRRRWYGLLPNKYGYKWSEGTSFSTPITATVAVLWLAHHGEKQLDEKYPEPWQKVEAFRKCVKESCRPHKPDVPENSYGVGLLDVEKLVKMDLPDKSTLIRVSEFTRDPGELTSNKEKLAYLTQKELTYHTACAKVQSIDKKNDELFEYVHRKASDTAKSMLDELARKEEIEKLNMEQEPNPKSEILKKQVKQHIEEWS